MQYSPKLKKAMEEVKSILKKYDIAGIVVLHNAESIVVTADGCVNTEGFTEYLVHINPSYSAATIEGDRFRVKGKAAHYGSPQERDKKMSATYNMMDHFATMMGNISMSVFDMYGGVKTMTEEISRETGPHTGHDQQNN